MIDQQDDEDKRENISSFINPELRPAHFFRPKEKENNGWGILRYISHEELKSRKYIVDDNLFLQVEIQENK